MNMTKPVLSLELQGIPLLKKGKVRNVYDLGDKLLFVATDRISAFDVIMQNGIPGKGRVLNMLSAFWFDMLRGVMQNHMITVDMDKIIREEQRLEPYRYILSGRSMLVKKAETVPIECIVRGYISGSGWRDYLRDGTVSGIKLPEGLEQSDRLEEPIFTPSTKADTGHDINISQEEMKQQLGRDTVEFLKEKSLAIYKKARDYAESKGIIIADTKFEFGRIREKIILIDEIFTPDSSRFWPSDDYKKGRVQKSFDKQFVRDYLETLDWDKTPPGLELPEEIVMKTKEKYIEIYEILTGNKFDE